MNSINMLLSGTGTVFKFDNPLYLLVLIPGVILAFFPYFRIRKDKRKTRERIVSMILHLLILCLASLVLAGFSIEKGTQRNDETMILIDVSDSNWHNSEEIANYINNVISEANEGNKVGVVVFGAGVPKIYKELQSKPKIDVNEIYKYYDSTEKDEEGFVMTEGTDLAKAIDFAARQFSNYYNPNAEKPLQRCRLIIFSDGIETDGNATSAAGNVAALGATIDGVYFAPKDYSDSKEAQIENVEISNNNPKPYQAVSLTTTVKSHYFGNNVKGKLKVYDLNASNPNQPLVISDGAVNTELEFDIARQEQQIVTSVSFATEGVHALKIEMETDFEQYQTGDRSKDNYKQNNVFYSYCVVQAKTNKILVLYGNDTDVTELTKLFDEEVVGENGYEVTIKKQNEAPTDLSKYGEVILCNVNSSDLTLASRLPSNYDMILNSYITNGGGVLTMGGKETYYFGGMQKDKFNDFLPVKVKPEATTSKGIVLLIDRSSGMCGGEGDNGFTGASGGKNRLQVVQEAFQLALMEGVFSPKDYFGVIFFGGNKYTPIKALEMTSASNVLGISKAINMDITAIAQGKNYLGSTDWRHALEAATQMLQSFNIVDNKHVILITDGAGDRPEGESSNLDGYPVGGWKYYGARLTGAAPSGLPEKVFTDYMLDRCGGITTSVINVGNNLEPAQTYMQAMVTSPANEQTTHYYKTNTAQEILDAVAIECKNIPTKLINDEQDTTILLQGKEMLKIAASEDIPEITGYNGTTLKDGAVASIIGQSTKDPIYAEWTYGKGKVGALMTDLTTDWGKMLIASGEAEGQAVIKHIVTSNFKGSVSGMASDMTVEFEQKNFTTNIVIKDVTNPNLVPTSTQTGIDVGIVEAYYHAPSKKFDATNDKGKTEAQYRDYLCPPSAGDNDWSPMTFSDATYLTKFNTMEPGLYTVAFKRMTSSNALIDGAPPYSYVTFSYSDEYDTFYDAQKSLLTLKEIVDSAGGEFYEKENGEMGDIFSTEAQEYRETIDPVAILMTAALLLFILDICARKFHFPLPTDFFKKKEEDAN